jgi:hypothetical protein
MVEFLKLMSKPRGVPTGEFAYDCSDLRYRNKTPESIGSRSAVWYEVCYRDTVAGDRKTLALFHAAHDCTAVVTQLPLTNQCRHGTSVAH